jgi:hypothetical protein
MRFLEIFALLVMIGFLIAGMYVFWLNFPTNLEYNTYVANTTSHLPSQSYQFYPNMRYINKAITYEIASECSNKKREAIISVFNLLEKQTVLRFSSAQKGEIEFFCTNLPPEPESSRHFVAGEGGPTQIINTTNYAAILKGKVSLYRSEKCERPIVALHEILHALGFDHTSDSKSIMFPIINCEQELDDFIIDQINTLYTTDAAPDLAIERVNAQATGLYLNFEISVANYGLLNAKNATLTLTAGSEFVRSFPLEELGFGQRKTLTVTNVRIPRNAETLRFRVSVGGNENELSNSNNEAEVRVQAKV